MRKGQLFSEAELAGLAKSFRLAAGKKRAEAARELGVARPSLIQAEESPEQTLVKLRKRIIETYSHYKVTGPFYRLEKK